MGQPGAEEVALVVDEHLGLVLQLAKCRRVDDAVAIALIGRACRRLGLVMQPPARRFGVHGIWRQSGTARHAWLRASARLSMLATKLVPVVTVWPGHAIMAGGLTPGFNPAPSRLILRYMEQFGVTERAA